MISGLLWRCPICKKNDSVLHYHRLLGPDKVLCRNCDTTWELRRVKGGTDFLFRAVSGPMAGIEHPLATWYDMMREGFDIVPIHSGDLQLQDGEVLNLRGKAENIAVLRIDPRFTEAISAIPAEPESDKNPESKPVIAHLGPVELGLTNKRLIVFWHQKTYYLELTSFRGIEILLDRIMIIRHEKRLIEILTFKEESPLKWRAYLENALVPIHESSGLKIRMPYD